MKVVYLKHEVIKLGDLETILRADVTAVVFNLFGGAEPQDCIPVA